MIAQKAIRLLKNGQVVLLSGGTTNLELANELPPSLHLTCFTPSIPIANQLLSKHNVEVILIGGKLSKDSQIAVGGTAINMLADIRAEICFLGTNSIDLEHGLTEFDWEIVEVKKAMIRASKKIVAPVISEKINSVQRYKICNIEQVDIMITELDPADMALQKFKDKNITVL